MPQMTLPRRLAALVALAVAAVALAGCATSFSSDATDRADNQALERLRAAPELPIDAVNFGVGQGHRVEVAATRWVDGKADPIDDGRVAEVLWLESITQIDSVDVVTVHRSGGPDDVVHIDRGKLEQWYGPRPNGLVTITAADLEPEQRGLLALVLGLGFLPLITGAIMLTGVIGVLVVVVLVVRSRRALAHAQPVPVFPGRLRLGAAIGFGLRALVPNLAVLGPLAAGLVVTGGGLAAAAGGHLPFARGSVQHELLAGLLGVAALLVDAWLRLALLRAGDEIAATGRATPGRCLRTEGYLRFCLGELVAGLLIAAGLLLLVVPGLVLLWLWSLFGPVLADQGRRIEPLRALGVSYQLASRSGTALALALLTALLLPLATSAWHGLGLLLVAPVTSLAAVFAYRTLAGRRVDPRWSPELGAIDAVRG